MTGNRFGRLTVLGYAGRESKWGAWWWRCDCGEVGKTKGHTLRQGFSKSCGCHMREVARAMFTTHGLSRRNPLYKVWTSIKQRCLNERCKSYAQYGGRGITVCDRWVTGDGERGGFECFYADMGDRPSTAHSVGRKDNDGPYEPGNCRWETPREQLANRRPYKKRKDAGQPRQW